MTHADIMEYYEGTHSGELGVAGNLHWLFRKFRTCLVISGHIYIILLEIVILVILVTLVILLKIRPVLVILVICKGKRTSMWDYTQINN